MDAIYVVISWVLTAAYLVAPLVAAGLAWRFKKVPTLGLTVAAGLLLGIGLVGAYAFAIGGTLPIGQSLLAGYLATAFLILLKAIDAGIWRLLAGKEPGRKRRIGATVGRAALLMIVGLPAIMAVIMVYRPKIVPPRDPGSELFLTYERVTFPARDGSRVVAWWIPAAESDKTIIVAHGLGGGKADILTFAGAFVGEYNLLIPDLRAHGESAGQVTTFGHRERFDILGAVDWLTTTHPEAVQDVYGVGASMGAAALLAASAETDRLDAIVVLGTFDDLGRLGDAIVGRMFLWPFDQVARCLALPVASAHAGADLANFRPADAAEDLWPRPVLVVHAQNDEIIPFARGRQLYERASEPKRQWWVETGGHNGIMSDEATLAEIKAFLNAARPVPLADATIRR